MTPTVQSVLAALREREIEPEPDERAGPGSHRAHCPACASARCLDDQAPPLLIAQNGTGAQLSCANGCAVDVILVELGLPTAAGAREPDAAAAFVRLQSPALRSDAGAAYDTALIDALFRLKRAETDMGNARRFALEHRQRAIYVHGLGWLGWDGARYAPDNDGAVMRLAKKTVRGIELEAAAMFEAAALEADESVREKKLKAASARLVHARRSQSQQRLDALLKCASSELELVVAVDELDRDPLLLNTPAGTVDLRSGELREHRPSDRITKLAGAALDRSTPTPHWDAFLHSTFAGDDELIAYVRRAVGYTATASTVEQCIFLAAGAGANGKTTALGAIAGALGEYAVTIDPVTFTTAASDRAARSDIARTAGARLVWGSETDAGASLALGLVKQYSGGDPIVARFLYRAEFEFHPVGKIWLTVNHLPRIGDDGHAVWRRVRVIPFLTRIERPDKHLAGKLRAEGPGILAWIVDGALQWRRHGLGTCPAVERATAAYRRREDRVGHFLAECCELDPEARVANGALRDAYHAWERARGGTPMTDLLDRLDRRGFGTYRTKSTRGRVGLRLSTAADRVTEGDG